MKWLGRQQNFQWLYIYIRIASDAAPFPTMNFQRHLQTQFWKWIVRFLKKNTISIYYKGGAFDCDRVEDRLNKVFCRVPVTEVNSPFSTYMKNQSYLLFEYQSKSECVEAIISLTVYQPVWLGFWASNLGFVGMSFTWECWKLEMFPWCPNEYLWCHLAGKRGTPRDRDLILRLSRIHFLTYFHYYTFADGFPSNRNTNQTLWWSKTWYIRTQKTVSTDTPDSMIATGSDLQDIEWRFSNKK